MSKRTKKEKPSAMRQPVRAINEGALRGESPPRIEETLHVSDGLNTLFYGNVNDPGALFWMDP